MTNLSRFCLLLTLMALFTTIACTFVATESATQRFYLVKSNYRNALTVVTQYKIMCNRKKLPDPCYSHVERLKAIDSEVYVYIESAQARLDSGVTTDFAIAVGSAEKAIDRILGYLKIVE